MDSKRWKRYLPFVILFAALLLRVVLNTPSVFSFWVDETDYANRATYIIDHGGKADPDFLFDHPPLFMYLQAGVFSVFGNEWYVARGLAVSIGVLTTFFFYAIGRELKNERLGLVMATLFAVAPVFVNVNRWAIIENFLGLLLCGAFLALLKYHRTKAPAWFLLGAVLVSMAIATKFTSIVFLPPVAVYVIMERMYRRWVLYVALVLSVLVLIPLLSIMDPFTFISFHLHKTSEAQTGYIIGGQIIYLGNAAAALMTLVWLNVGLAPFALYLKERAGSKKKYLKSSIRWMRKNPMKVFLLVWAVSSLCFFSTLKFMTVQYIYTILLPVTVLMGMILYERPKLCKVIVIVYLCVSITLVAFARSEGSDMTVNYLTGKVRATDAMVTSDTPVFHYYFPDNDVQKATKDELSSTNATYVVLKTTAWDEFQKNTTIAQNIGDNYTEVYRTDLDQVQVNFIVFQRR